MGKGIDIIGAEKTRYIGKEGWIKGADELPKKIKEGWIKGADGLPYKFFGGGGKFTLLFAKGYSDVVKIANSDNAVNWTESNLTTPITGNLYFYDIEYGNGVYVMVTAYYSGGSSKFTFWSSYDTLTWESNNYEFSFSIRLHLSFCNGKFIVVCGYNVYTSLDGKTWTLLGDVKLPRPSNFTGNAFSGGMTGDIVYGSYNGNKGYICITNRATSYDNDEVLFSTDLINWSIITTFNRGSNTTKYDNPIFVVDNTVYFFVHTSVGFGFYKVNENSSSVTKIFVMGNVASNFLYAVCDCERKTITYLYRGGATHYIMSVDLTDYSTKELARYGETSIVQSLDCYGDGTYLIISNTNVTSGTNKLYYSDNLENGWTMCFESESKYEMEKIIYVED